MNKFFFFTFLLFILSCNNERQNVEHLIFKNKLAFKPESEKPYTGKVFRLNRKGNIEFEGYLNEGKRDGEFTFYDEDGIVNKIENYRDGEENGEFIYYFNDGRVMSKRSYKDGKEDGKFEIYIENGNKNFEGSFVNGLKEGKHKYWFTNGKQLQTEFDCKKGTIIIESVKEYYIDGKIKTQFERLSKNNYKMIEYYDNGQIKHKLNFLYSLYEDEVDNTYFNIIVGASNTESQITIDLGNSFNHFFGVEYIYNKEGKTLEKTNFFFPSNASVFKKYYNGDGSTYDDVTSYTEVYDESGKIIKKCANTSSGELGCVEGNELNNMVLLVGDKKD
jgi:antitoxin component YwqK of YwqJK toxin-antitoxin module